MTPDLKKFEKLGKDLASDRGDLTLYALLEREDEPGRWDLVVSAPWVQGVTIDGMEYIIDKMKKRLTAQERDSVAHIILLRPEEQTVRNIIRSSHPVTDTLGIIKDDISRAYINGMLITRGYILATNRYRNSAA